MKLDHGFMTVYHELDPQMELPVVPIALNCTTPPLMTLRQSYEFGKSVGAAIRSDDGLERVGLVGAGGLSHFVGEPGIGDIDEDFDRWFLKELEREPLSDDLLDMPNDEAGSRNTAPTIAANTGVMIDSLRIFSRTG